MHRILHYVVMTNRLRTPLTTEQLVAQVAVHRTKAVESTTEIVSVEGKKEVNETAVKRIISSPEGQS